jgi:ubiquinone/menaquinone biosynthesis C-methylase UbiE
MSGQVGKHIGAFSSALRPRPLVELEHWGGEALVRGRRVLDLGCGDGRFALGIAPLAAAVEGLDPDPEAVAAAESNARGLGLKNTRFTVGAAQHLPYRDGSLDVVLLSWSL